jgi:hypothetical protein
LIIPQNSAGAYAFAEDYVKEQNMKKQIARGLWGAALALGLVLVTTVALAGCDSIFGSLPAITGLKASPGSSAVTLSWANPGDNFDHIEVTVTPAASTGGAPYRVTKPAASYKVTGLTNGKAYTFNVVTVSASGKKSAPATVTSTPITSSGGSSGGGSPGNNGPVGGNPPAAPGAPTVPAYVEIDVGQITVTWTAVANATAYEVYYGTTNTPTTKFGSDVSVATATITGLASGTTYYVRIKAKNASGTSDYGAVSTACKTSYTLVQAHFLSGDNDYQVYMEDGLGSVGSGYSFFDGYAISNTGGNSI